MTESGTTLVAGARRCPHSTVSAPRTGAFLGLRQGKHHRGDLDLTLTVQRVATGWPSSSARRARSLSESNRISVAQAWSDASQTSSPARSATGTTRSAISSPTVRCQTAEISARAAAAESPLARSNDEMASRIGVSPSSCPGASKGLLRSVSSHGPMLSVLTGRSPLAPPGRPGRDPRRVVTIRPW